MTRRSCSTHVGQIHGENLKRIFANHRITFDGFSVIHNTTKYDDTTKPQAVIQKYFRKHFLELFLGFCKTNLVIYEPVITQMLAAYWGLQNRAFLFFWILNASINLCWHEIQSFCGSNHLLAYNEVDAYCVMTSSK